MADLIRIFPARSQKTRDGSCADDDEEKSKQHHLQTTASPWRPLGPRMLGLYGNPAMERSVYSMYGGLFGLSAANSAITIPTFTLGVHPFATMPAAVSPPASMGMDLTTGSAAHTSHSSIAHSSAASRAESRTLPHLCAPRFHPYLTPAHLKRQADPVIN